MLLIIIVVGCKKEGCTDPLALNFDSEAKKKSGCLYQLDWALWFSEQTAISFTNDGVTEFKVVKGIGMDAVTIGYFDVTSFSASSPNCGDGAFTYSEIFSSRDENYYYSGDIYKITATDTIWLRSVGISCFPVNMFGTTCNKFELTY